MQTRDVCVFLSVIICLSMRVRAYCSFLVVLQQPRWILLLLNLMILVPQIWFPSEALMLTCLLFCGWRWTRRKLFWRFKLTQSDSNLCRKNFALFSLCPEWLRACLVLPKCYLGLISKLRMVLHRYVATSRWMCFDINMKAWLWTSNDLMA